MPPAAAARRATSGTRVFLDEFARRNNPRLRGLATMRKNEIQSNTTKYNRRMYGARERSQGGILAGGDLPSGKYNRPPLDVVTRDTLTRSRKGITLPPEPPRRRVGSLGKACARPFQRAMSTGGAGRAGGGKAPFPRGSALGEQVTKCGAIWCNLLHHIDKWCFLRYNITQKTTVRDMSGRSRGNGTRSKV